MLVLDCTPLMGTIVKGQSRAILPVRFLLRFACQFIVAFLLIRSVFKKVSCVFLLFAIRSLRRACIV